MTALFGHDEAARGFLDAVRSGRLHHAWLLSGPEGIGKARFATMAATTLLAGADDRLVDDPDHPVARLVAARSHPDFRHLERLTGENRDQDRRNIPIADVRGLQPLLHGTGSLSARRVVIVDAVDDLERSAANALLKSLEEPQSGVVFLLVSHAPGRLLPTIRSRVRPLRFHPLGEEAMRRALRGALPEAEDAEFDALVAVGEGAPGRALGFAGLDVAGLDRALDAMAADGDPDQGARLALMKALSGKAQQPRYRLFLERVPHVIAGVARRRRGEALARALAAWDEARALSASAVPLSLDAGTTVWRLGSLVSGLAGAPAAAKG